MRFRSASDKQVGLFNMKSGLTVETAPIKSQCSRDYFYSKNPIFENEFTKIEVQQKQLFARIIDQKYIPSLNSRDHHDLLACIMFQLGRTVTTAAHQDDVANQFGKAILRKHFERDGRDDMLAYLDRVNISVPNGVLDAIQQHLTMYPLLGDLEIALFQNESNEDFITSDHPVALCNSLPSALSPHGANVGFASRGLLVLLPLSPRVLLLLSDREAYKIATDENGVVKLAKARDVIELNVAQCFNAYENLYFASAAKVQATLSTYRKRREQLRPAPPILSEAPALTREGKRAILLSLPAPKRRLVLPRAIEVRHTARTEKYKQGDAFVRDPLRTEIVKAELDRIQALREAATQAADAAKTGSTLTPE